MVLQFSNSYLRDNICKIQILRTEIFWGFFVSAIKRLRLMESKVQLEVGMVSTYNLPEVEVDK